MYQLPWDKPLIHSVYGSLRHTNHLFVDCKAVFDRQIRRKLYEIIYELGIPVKRIRLCKMTLTNSKSAVNVGKDLTEPFEINRDTLSCDVFNILMEIIMRKAAENIMKNISSKCHILCEKLLRCFVESAKAGSGE